MICTRLVHATSLIRPLQTVSILAGTLLHRAIDLLTPSVVVTLLGDEIKVVGHDQCDHPITSLAIEISSPQKHRGLTYACGAIRV